jgi:non-specific serine/threonine protein kinase
VVAICLPQSRFARQSRLLQKRIRRPSNGATRPRKPTLQTLRRLVYPFILRRTKEQVAPELPPRTERIIYTDLEPAQRKLYQQTRDYYRGLLLGLLEESQDINDMRFKILEGCCACARCAFIPAWSSRPIAANRPSSRFCWRRWKRCERRSQGAGVLAVRPDPQPAARRDGRARHGLRLPGRPDPKPPGTGGSLPERPESCPFSSSASKPAAFGLNLTAADYVLHIDPWWNPAVEMQAADRAHRIGQDKPVFIYKFIARETVEEKIMQLQERKRELVEQLISAEGVSSSR